MLLTGMSKKVRSSLQKLHLVSSGTKIWNQLIILAAVGLLPIFFPHWAFVRNRTILLINIGVALVTSLIYEIWRGRLVRAKKDTSLVINLQLITSVVLLTIFLHFFGYINGPFFVLYLLTTMESALNLNTKLPDFVVAIAAFFTYAEFVFLISTGKISLDFYNFLALFVRISSLFFMRAYGKALAEKIVAEQAAKEEAEASTRDLKAVTGKLRKANLRLKELSKLKDEFVSVASHELRTPMTAIKSYLWLALKKDQLDAKTRKNLQRAFESTERSIKLVKDMLTVSRIEGQRLEVNRAPLDLAKLTKKVYDELKVQAEDKQISFQLQLPKIALTVNADEARLREVIVNIIGNAIKFTPKRGKVVVKIKKKNQQIQTDVIDNGPGIPKEALPRLFKKFSRADHSFAKLAEQPGTGLGLYIAKQILDLHQGKIWVKSKVGQGSTFSFSLPSFHQSL